MRTPAARGLEETTSDCLHLAVRVEYGEVGGRQWLGREHLPGGSCHRTHERRQD